MAQPYTMGDLGGRIIDSSSGALTGLLCRSLQVIEEAVVTNIAITGVVDANKLETTLPVGVYLFGQGITEITISSGLIYLGA